MLFRSALDNRTYLTKLVINPVSGFDPFSVVGKCSAFNCRRANAADIARTIGLYADTALITDWFTPSLASVEKWTSGKLYTLAANIIVLQELRPLFEAGVFRFVRSPALCQSCYRKFTKELRKTTDELLPEVCDQVTFQVERDHLIIDHEQVYGTPIVTHSKLTPKQKDAMRKGAKVEEIGLPILAAHVRKELEEMLLTMGSRTPTHSTTFSNSRVALLGARQFEGTRPVAKEVELWEASRSAQLPWVRDLTTNQIVQLRDEASKALPRFRQRMAKAMVATDEAKATNVIEAMRELQSEAAEVDAELQALHLAREGRLRNLASGLGIAISVYGFATEIIAAGAALTGLASMLGLVHAANRKDEQDHDRAVSRPAYVLVKAREILQHAQDDRQLPSP